MIKRIMSRLMMVFVMAVLVVGFAQVLTPTPLQAWWVDPRCDHQVPPPCPPGKYFKYVVWVEHWDPEEEEHYWCPDCSYCQGLGEVCYID